MTDLSQRLIRYADLKPCLNAFVDTRTPGSDRKENFTLIGPGVSENPGQHVHIAERHGFNIGAARQPPGCLNSQHSHDTAEVFVVHRGRWRFMWGPQAGDGSVELGPGDTISIPTRMFRGFANIGDEVGFLFAVLGGDDPGKVTWAPKVFDLAQHYGLVLLEGGRLIDTTAGETVPPGARRQQPPTAREIADLASPTNDRLAACVLPAAALRPNPSSALAAPGVAECPVIIPRGTRDGFAPGPISGWWPHGFTLRCLRFDPGASVPDHARDEEEVLFVHAGALEVTVDGESLLLAAGDTFTTPRGAARRFRATSSDGAMVFVVRGGEDTAPARFLAQKAA
jgi:quercetin dioxygenase-like cupin family protein